MDTSSTPSKSSKIDIIMKELEIKISLSKIDPIKDKEKYMELLENLKKLRDTKYN